MRDVSSEMQRIIACHREDRSVIPVLQEIQGEIGWLPEPALEAVARGLQVPLSQVYGVATFYSQFSLKPRGKRLLRVCFGTACYVRGAPQVFEELEKLLGLREDRLSQDGQVEVEVVRCLGACALAPVVVAPDGQYHGGMTPAKARALVKSILRRLDDQVQASGAGPCCL